MNQLEQVYDRQVSNRNRHEEKALSDYYAVGVTNTTRDNRLSEGFDRIGSFTYTSLTRRHAPGVPRPALVLSGYKSGVDEVGRIWVGGPNLNCFAYDLSLKPFSGASNGGKILSTRKTATLDLFLDMDREIETAAQNKNHDRRFEGPNFWYGFEETDMPDVTLTPAVRKRVMEDVRPGSNSPVPDYLLSPGGTVEKVWTDDSGVYIDWRNAESFNVGLPPTAVLRPFIREGVEVAAGIVIADLMPRRNYPHWGHLASMLSEELLTIIAADIVYAHDIMFDGLRCRRAELCGQQKSEHIFEDVRHLQRFETNRGDSFKVHMREQYLADKFGEDSILLLTESVVAEHEKTEAELVSLRDNKPAMFQELARWACCDLPRPRLLPASLVTDSVKDFLRKRLVPGTAYIQVLKGRPEQGLTNDRLPFELDSYSLNRNWAHRF